MSLVDIQLEQLRARYEQLDCKKLPSGTVLVTIPDVPLPAGWNKTKTSVRFLVPAAYPHAALDCFWADQDLRLAGERMPTNAGADNQIPEAGSIGLWFSWHLEHPWNPNRDTLSSWVSAINDRLRRLQ